jgi:UDPglucose 6-dehydrogenase
MRISIVGTGYVGLVSGLCLAEVGHEVICVDSDADKIAQIVRGEVPFVEKGLDALLRRNLGTRFLATTDLARAVRETELTLIAVGTPFDGDQIDLTYIRNVSREIGAELATLSRYHVVVVKSTVVPGTTDDVVLPLLEQASGRLAGADFGVGMKATRSPISCTLTESCWAA